MIRSRNLNEWNELLERYFEATTTEAEERELKHFAVSSSAVGEEWNELRAVLGYVSLGGVKHRKRKNKKTHSIYVGALATAASVALVMTIFLNENRQMCEVYANGNRITDKNIVLSYMNNTMSNIDIANIESENSVEQGLSDMFKTLNEE